MKIFYFIVTHLRDYKKCTWDLYQSYFDGMGFAAAFLIAVCVAFVFAFIFYVILGRKFSTSKLSLWLVLFAISGAVSFGITAYSATGGLQNEIKTIKKEKIHKGADRHEIQKIERQLKKDTKFTKCTVTQVVASENLVYTLLFFYLFSLALKHEPITKFATEIPHKKP